MSSFSPVLNGYGDLLDNLNTEDSESEVDKVVKYILNQNLSVQNISVILADITNGHNSLVLNKLSVRGLIVVGRFTRGELGENVQILKRWNELQMKVPVLNPFKCINDFHKLLSSKVKRKLTRKKNVLGCYLGQDLTRIRHASDVFHHAFELLNPPTFKGKFTKEEDQLILSEVAKTGECKGTWKQIAGMLNRSNCSSIKMRFFCLTTNRFLQRGQFDISEDEYILRSLFSGKKDTDIQEIESITQKDFTDIAESLNRSIYSVSLKWKGSLKPILLSHHFGTLHRPWKKELFQYLIDKKVIARQDINYHELKTILPEQNPISIKYAITNYKGDESFILWKRIKEVLSDMKDSQEREKLKAYREKIVDIYDRVINE